MAKKSKKNKKKAIKSPLGINQTLVRGAAGSNYQLGGESSLSGGDWRGDLMTRPIMAAFEKQYLGNKEEENKEKSTGDTITNNYYNGEKKLTASKIDMIGLEDQMQPGYNEDDLKPIQATEAKLEKAKKEGNKEEVKKYEIQVAKEKRKLANAFGLFGRKKKKQYDEDTQKEMKGRFNEANRKKRKLEKSDNFDPESDEYKDTLQTIQSNKAGERIQNMVRVKKPDGTVKIMTNDEAQQMIKDNDLINQGGRGGGDKVNVRYGDFYSRTPATARESVLKLKSKRANIKGNSPYSYKERLPSDTPMYQLEEFNGNATEAEEINSSSKQKKMPSAELPEVVIEGDAFDLMQREGSADIKNWIDTVQFIGDELPPQLLGASATDAIQEFMEQQKEELNRVLQEKGGEKAGLNIINNAKLLATNLNKIGPYIEEEINSISEETESNGSSVASRYLRDVLITKKTDEQGKPLTTMIVDNNNELAIKFRDTKGTYNLTSLKQDVFPKAFQSFDAVAKGLTHMKNSAEAGVPFDEEGSMVLINNAIKTEQDILSSIHDEESPLYQFLNDFAEQYPKANTDFAHIDSPNYSKNDLAPLVKNYALQKLRAQHRLHSKANSNSKLTAEQIIKKFS